MEIRRIRQTEADAVTDLWDEAGRSVPDGGPLKERGRRNIAAMLALAASHQRAACFVAIEDGRPVGMVMAELDEGLLPGRAGLVAELYARGDADTERALVRAATAWVFEQGAAVIRSDVPLDEQGGELLEALGFEPETVRYGLYRDE
jgi:predicted N-acetyltransferase YhbS